MNQFATPVPQKSGGCLKWTCGCLGTMFVFFLLFVGGMGALLYYTLPKVETYALSFYQSDIRPNIEKELNIPEPEKSKLLADLDAIVAKFPEMSWKEKGEAIGAFMKKYNPDQGEQNPEAPPSQ